MGHPSRNDPLKIIINPSNCVPSLPKVVSTGFLMVSSKLKGN